MKGKNPIQAILLLAFLVLVPLGSWYYLRMGYDYRKEALDQMRDLGPFPVLNANTVDGKLNVVDSLEGKMVIAHVLSTANEDLTSKYGKAVKELHEQFKFTNRLAIVTLGADPTVDTPERLSKFAQQYELEKQPHYYLIAPDSNGVESIAKQLYFPELDLKNSIYFALADTSKTVKNHYVITDEESVRELVVHTAMFMPKSPRRRVIFKRETEK